MFCSRAAQTLLLFPSVVKAHLLLPKTKTAGQFYSFSSRFIFMELRSCVPLQRPLSSKDVSHKDVAFGGLSLLPKWDCLASEKLKLTKHYISSGRSGDWLKAFFFNASESVARWYITWLAATDGYTVYSYCVCADAWQMHTFISVSSWFL